MDRFRKVYIPREEFLLKKKMLSVINEDVQSPSSFSSINKDNFSSSFLISNYVQLRHDAA